MLNSDLSTPVAQQQCPNRQCRGSGAFHASSLSEAKMTDKSSSTDLYYRTTTSYLPTTLHTLHIKSAHLLTVEGLVLSAASSYEPLLQALAAAHLLDPLPRPRPGQDRLLPPSSSQALAKRASKKFQVQRKKGWLAPNCKKQTRNSKLKRKRPIVGLSEYAPLCKITHGIVILGKCIK